MQPVHMGIVERITVVCFNLGECRVYRARKREIESEQNVEAVGDRIQEPG
jgi:hypothetical protein